MTSAASRGGAVEVTPQVRHELDIEQAHVDRVYAEVVKATARADAVAADGLARGRTERVGDARDEELTGLFERDALVHHAARRRHALETQHEGLVFGRLDSAAPGRIPDATSTAQEREVMYVGRLGVRDDDYEPLVIDWRAPAAAPFYRATPVEPLGVVRRRVLRSSGSRVVGVEDDLMVPEAPDDLVVVGDGALMAALTRTRGSTMTDIVATIQRHQDEAIRAPGTGITEITGGPGTGKTVVALHRAAFLLYAERRRYEAGGILVVGPSTAYTAYIERVLPSLGEESVTLRALGDLVDAVSTDRLDAPPAAAVKGSARMHRVLQAAARDLAPGAPQELRTFIGGMPVRVRQDELARIRERAVRQNQRNLSLSAIRSALAEAAFRSSGGGDRANFDEAFDDHLAVEDFLEAWWPQVDPREVLLWLADRERLARYAGSELSAAEQETLAASLEVALSTGTWSVADVALIDDLAAMVGPVQEPEGGESAFEIDELDDVSRHGVQEVSIRGARSSDAWRPGYETVAHDPRGRLLAGTIGRPRDFAHVLVDEAQDLSPMQWRALGRRGRRASWTVVGDAAQSSWPSAAEADRARAEAFAGQQRRTFHMSTNYRNAREIFAYAERVIRPVMPDADIPDAVRETGIEPREVALPRPLGDVAVREAVAEALRGLLDAVDGSIAIVAPQRWHSASAAGLAEVQAADPRGARAVLVDPMSTKGLEWDATVVVDPEEIIASSPGGARILYVVLTRAAHRMTVLR